MKRRESSRLEGNEESMMCAGHPVGNSSFQIEDIDQEL